MIAALYEFSDTIQCDDAHIGYVIRMLSAIRQLVGDDISVATLQN